MNTSAGTAWIAAILAPWTISPHPNFSVETIPSAARLALVSELRADELDRYGDDPVDWVNHLVGAAARSLSRESQEGAVDELWAWTADPGLPWGARVAAGAFALLGWSELDRVEEGVREYLSALQLDHADEEAADASTRVITAAAFLQAAFRMDDTGNSAQASRWYVDALHWLPSDRARGWEEFPVSLGISWRSKRVQLDIGRVIRERARAAQSRLEFPYGSTWENVIRSRRGWVSSRVDRKLEWMYRRARDDAFQTQFASARRANTIGFTQGEDNEYGSLLLAELGADRDAARAARIAQAQRHLQDALHPDSATPIWVQQALRLLRQSEADTFLKDALAWVRTGGPLEALRQDAAAVLARVSVSGSLTDTDLLTLGAAGDLLPVQLLRLASEAVLDDLARASSWSARNARWEALETLAPDSGLDNRIAEVALQFAGDRAGMNAVLAATVGRTLEGIDWLQVAPSTQTAWRELLEGAAAESSTQVIADLIGTEIGMIGQVASPPGVMDVARLVDGPTGDLPEPHRALARDIVLQALSGDLMRAREGGAAFGGIDNGNLAVAFSSKFEDDVVWGAVAEYLVDQQLNPELKQRALLRIADQPGSVPPNIVQRLAPAVATLLHPEVPSFLGGSSSLPFNTAALRTLSALNLIESATAQDLINQLYAQGEVGRLEVARSLPAAATSGGATWAASLLTALTYDPSPQVRAEAGFALTQLPATELDGQRWTRLQQLLLGDGVRIPLRIVHACQRLVAIGQGVPEQLQPALTALSDRTDRSRIVHGAVLVLQNLEQDKRLKD